MAAHGASAVQKVRGPTRAGVGAQYGRPAVAAAVPSGVAPSGAGGWGGASGPVFETPDGEPRLIPRPGDVNAVSIDVAWSQLVPRAVARRQMGREAGVLAPRNSKADVAGPAAPAAGAAAAPLNLPARRRRRKSVKVHALRNR